jgi:cytochrome c-type biogenesis protein CcmH
MNKYAFAILFGLLTATSSLAVEPGEIMSDPTLEARARVISTGLRCLVCQNQSIDDSNAGLARDLRLIVRERLAQGDTDDQVRDYVVSRFGNYVLLEPPMQTNTIALWAAPFLVLLTGMSIYAIFLRRRRTTHKAENAELTADEQRQLEALGKSSR